MFIFFSGAYYSSFSQGSHPVKDTTSINPDSVYSKVDIRAKFPGGEEARKLYMRQNLNGDVALKRGAPLGVYTVIINCTIDTSGIFISILPETKYGYGMEEEAIRVIGKFPQWLPAIKNNLKVKSSLKFPITFKVFR